MVGGQAALGPQLMQDEARRGNLGDGAQQADIGGRSWIAGQGDLQRALGGIAGIEEGGQREEIAADLSGKAGNQDIGLLAVFLIPCQMIEGSQHLQHRAIAGGHGVILRVLGAQQDIVGIVRGCEIAAICVIPIMRIQGLDPAAGLVEEPLMAGDLKQRKRGGCHIGIILQRCRMTQDMTAPAVTQPAVDRHFFDHMIEGADRDPQPVGMGESEAGMGERTDHQAVPVGQHLIVPAWPHAFLAMAEQGLTKLGELALRRAIAEVRPTIAMQDGNALPITLGRHVIGAFETLQGLARLIGQQLIDFRLAPDIEFAFHTLAIGIERAGETAFLSDHFAQHPADGLFQALPEQGPAGFQGSMGQQFDELGIVVQHLLEMRGQPLRIGGIAGKAAAQMIVDSALAHALQRQQDIIA